MQQTIRAWDVEKLQGDLYAYLDQKAPMAMPTDVPEGFRCDAKGDYIAERNIAPRTLLEDQTVTLIASFWFRLANEVARFRERVFSDVATYISILEDHYEAKRRGRKGNLTMRSFDGRLELEIQVQERIAFGPELQVAKGIIDELAAEWTEDARPEVRAIINTAFDTSKEGNVNIGAVLRLRRIEIDDPRWSRAMEAISDAVAILGSKVYARLYLRPDPQGQRFAVAISIASDWTDPAWDTPRDPAALRQRYSDIPF